MITFHVSQHDVLLRIKIDGELFCEMDSFEEIHPKYFTLLTRLGHEVSIVEEKACYDCLEPVQDEIICPHCGCDFSR